MEHEEKEILIRLLRDTEDNSREIARILHIVRKIEHEVRPQPQPFPTSISFTQQGDPMALLPPVAGNTLVYTGTLAPAGSAFAADTTFTLVSSDPTVTPTVDATGLIVTIPLPSTFVDNPASPFNVVYTAASVSAGASITATITPSIPAPFPTSITFVQTT